MVDSMVLKMSSKEKVTQSFLKMDVNLKWAKQLKWLKKKNIAVEIMLI